LSLILALSQYPFTLLLTFFRIAYHAWILHYIKRLDVFVKPDPLPNFASERDAKNTSEDMVHIGVKYIPEGFLESYARRRVEEFLYRRVDELGIEVVLIPVDPSESTRIFSQSPPATPGLRLAIDHASPVFYTSLLISPSPAHALLLDRVWNPSDENLFLSVFSSPLLSNEKPRSTLQSLRTHPIPHRLCIELPIPPVHPLDIHSNSIPTTLWVIICHLSTHIEHGIFVLFKARVVKGGEPWTIWDRAERKFSTQGPTQGIGVEKDLSWVGSVRRD
jgi:hypothetical protein